jgi:hypothetical protein
MALRISSYFKSHAQRWGLFAGVLALNVFATATDCVAPHISNDSWTETVYLDHLNFTPPNNCNFFDHEYRYTRNMTQEIWSNGLRYSCPSWHLDGCATNWTPLHALPTCPKDTCTIGSTGNPD